MPEAKELLDQHDRRKTRRATYEPKLQECAEYIRPMRSNIANKIVEGTIDTSFVCDSTALDANRKLGARLTGTLCSQAIRWHGLKVADKQVNDDEEVRQWFDDCADEMMLAYAQSLFYAEINEVMADLPGLGTGGIFGDEAQPSGKGFNGLYTRACSVGSITMDEGPDGLIDVVDREFSLSARAALKKFPKGLHEKTMELAGKKPEELVDFLHIVQPREGTARMRLKADGSIPLVAAKRLPWASYYLEVKRKHLVSEGGYHEMPYAMGRWSRPGDDLYGRGIGHDALPDVKSLSKSREMFLKQWALAVQPPLKKRRNLKTPVRQVPAAVNEVLNPDDITEMVTNARFDVANAGINDLRTSVRNMWFDDQLSLKESPQMTAVEVMARLELMQQLMGPNIGRVMFEILNRFVERVFGIMLRANCFPPAPKVLVEYMMDRGGWWQVEYQSPLARAQRNPELVAIERTVQIETMMQPIHPEVTDALDADKTIRHAADVAGLPAKLIRSEEEVAQIRKARRDQQQIDAELNRVAVGAKAAGDASGMVDALNQPAQRAA